MKNSFCIITFLFFAMTSFGQNEAPKEKKTEPCESVILKFKNYSFRNYQITVPDQMTISAAKIGTTTFHVTPGQEMMFSENGQNYPLLTAGTDITVIEHYNLNRLIKKRKRELGI